MEGGPFSLGNTVTTSFFDLERLIHSLKTAIAVLIGYLIAHVIGLPSGQWIVITILVVMCAQLYVGSVLQKSWLRFLGTIAGCAAAIVMIVTRGHSWMDIAITLMLTSFVFSYFATWRDNLTYAGTLGAVTTAIIILGQEPTVLFALERFMEICVGLMIATLVSQFALPIHARSHLRSNQAETLQQLREYYREAMMQPDNKAPPDFIEMDENIAKSLLRQRALARESASEPLGVLFNPEHFSKTLYAEREILRSMTFMHSALVKIVSPLDNFLRSLGLHRFNERIMESLNVLIQAVEQEQPAKAHIHLPSLGLLKEALQSEAGNFSREELIYMDGFLFCAEVLTKSLGQLATLYEVTIYEEKA